MFCFGATASSAWVTSVYPGITPDDAQGTIWDTGDQPRTRVQGQHPTFCIDILALMFWVLDPHSIVKGLGKIRFYICPDLTLIFVCFLEMSNYCQSLVFRNVLQRACGDSMK